MLSMHPGEYISEAYLEPLGLSHTDLASRLNVSVSTISRIINGKADVSPSMALRLSHVLGRSPESWLAMQAAHSLNEAKLLIDTSKLRSISIHPH